MCIIINNKCIELCFIELKVYIFLWIQRRKTMVEMLKDPPMRFCLTMCPIIPVTWDNFNMYHFLVALIITTYRCSCMREWWDRLWYNPTTEKYSAVQRNEQLVHATWMNLKEIMLSKKANLKRIHTARFHLLSIPEKKNYRIILWYYYARDWWGMGLRGDEDVAEGRLKVMVKCLDCGVLAQSYTYDHTA